jgi:type I pullulanase
MFKSYQAIKDIELGSIYEKEKTVFRVYAPERKKIDLCLTDDYRKVRKEKIPMKKNSLGIFELEVKGDLDGIYYSYLVEDKYEVTDPYSKASSINSIMSCVVDLSSTDPDGFRESSLPENKENGAIIYELSVKDFTVDKSSGVKNKGKFLGLAENDSKIGSFSTGLSHLKELGVSHVQILPIYDFISVFEESERFFDDDNYNWGYDPELYFNVEGSYSTDPHNPKNRIYELKYMIDQIHKQGMSVIMDVVYNHTFKTYDSNFEILAPGYYHRRNPDGSYSNGSGIGNEFSSEKPFGRKLIIDSLKYWVEEFKIDGFRFDLMALIDLDTMELAIKELKKINPNIIIYGEPWMAFDSVLPESQQLKTQAQRSKGFGIFNDRFRNAIKGDNDGYEKGYIQGNFSLKKRIEEGMAGSIFYDETRPGICDFASESINYFNCHDNLIFYDKLLISLNDRRYIDDITKIAFGILYLSLGKPFIYQGNEFNHSKNKVRNSYNSPINVNKVDWNLKKKNIELFEFVKELIDLRKSYKIFTNVDPDRIRKNMIFLDFLPDSMVGYKIKDENTNLLVIINALDDRQYIYKEDLLKFFGRENLDKPYIKKVFSKNGKIDKKIKLDEKNEIEKFSINVYEIGGEYEL